MIICIAGNKVDLAHLRQVQTQVAESYAREIQAIYIETSAKEDTNVQKLFEQLSEKNSPLRSDK